MFDHFCEPVSPSKATVVILFFQDFLFSVFARSTRTTLPQKLHLAFIHSSKTHVAAMPSFTYFLFKGLSLDLRAGYCLCQVNI